VVLLSLGLAAAGLATGYGSLAVGFTLMPIGTAFLFPCVTGLLTRVVPSNERGLYMGVQHTYGGISRVAFPIAAGFLMDRAGVGVPFWVSGVLVLAMLPLTWALVGYAVGDAPSREAARVIATADITDEFPIVEPPDAKPASGG